MSDIVEASPFPVHRTRNQSAPGGGAWGVAGITVTIAFLSLFLLASLSSSSAKPSRTAPPSISIRCSWIPTPVRPFYLTLTIAAILGAA